MGCCGKGNKKSNKSKSNVTKRNKVEKKLNNKEIKTIDDQIPQKVIDQNQLLKSENNVQQELIKAPIQTSSPLEERHIKSPSSDYDIDDISPTDNISPIKTLNDLQILVQQNKKPVSIILFYGRYCPYSKRTIPGLRQWARTNQDRIFLYEADVEQASKLADYYHVRTIPTLMAFEENNLLAPIWQRTANNVLSSINNSESITDNKQISLNNQIEKPLDNSNNIFVILDPSVKGSNSFKSPNENHQEQYLILLDNNQSTLNKSKLITNENEFIKSIDQAKSDTLSRHSPYIWNKSISSVDNNSQNSEYNGRMISQSALSTISNDDQSRKKRTWSEYLDDHITTNEYQQHIHLPNCNEIYYEKQYDDNTDTSYDRFSTLTYQHVKNTNNFPMNQQEEICILYLGPNQCRGFEDNLPIEKNSSKLSLVTLKSHSLLE